MSFSKKTFFLIFNIFFVFAIDLLAFEHLVLHFDINKTLIASDQTGGKTLDNGINHLLAEKYIGFWDDKHSDSISYYDYVYKILSPSDPEDPGFKKNRNKYLNQFIKHVNAIEHPLKDKINQEYQDILVKLDDCLIFQSFFSLLIYLDAKKISYSIILRSFGKDLTIVASTIENNQNHIFFDEFASFKKGKLYVDQKVISSNDEIYKFIASRKNIIIQDDWHWWQSHTKIREFGKPFYVNPNNSDILEIFFDDNIEDVLSTTDIIFPINALNGKSIKIEPLIKNGQIVKVNTIQAILDDEYFIKKINKALINQTKAIHLSVFIK